MRTEECKERREQDDKAVADATVSKQSVPTARQMLRFALHLAAVYVLVTFCTPWLSGWIHDGVLPALHSPSRTSSFQFLFSNLLILSFIPAVLAGFANARFRHEIALLVAVVPAAVLAWKLAMFPTSIFADRFAVVFHHYFGGGFLIPEFQNWRELFDIAGANADMRRGMDQLHYTAPFYAALGYALGSFVGLRIGVNRLARKLANIPPPRNNSLSST